MGTTTANLWACGGNLFRSMAERLRLRKLNKKQQDNKKKKKPRADKKQQKKQHKKKGTRKERSRRVRAAIASSLQEEGDAITKGELRKIVSAKVGFSLDGRYWLYCFEKAFKKATRHKGRNAARRKRPRFKLGFGKS